jgi:hypothetical protein
MKFIHKGNEYIINEWKVNGVRHRLDGPAVEYPDGSCEWWWNGKQVDHLSWLLLVHEYRNINQI